MNTKDLPAMYSTAFWYLFVILLVFLALLGNHCYFFHRMKWRLVTSICRHPGPVATRMPFFFAEIQIRSKFFSSGLRGKPLLPLWDWSARKKIHNFPIKSSHLCRTSWHVWLSSSPCDHCCAYQLICIMTISTYTTGASTRFFTLQEPSWRVISALAPVV